MKNRELSKVRFYASLANVIVLIAILVVLYLYPRMVLSVSIATGILATLCLAGWYSVKKQKSVFGILGMAPLFGFVAVRTRMFGDAWRLRNTQAGLRQIEWTLHVMEMKLKNFFEKNGKKESLGEFSHLISADHLTGFLYRLGSGIVAFDSWEEFSACPKVKEFCERIREIALKMVEVECHWVVINGSAVIPDPEKQLKNAQIELLFTCERYSAVSIKEYLNEFGVLLNFETGTVCLT